MPSEPQRGTFGSTSRVIIAVVTASLLVGGCVICAGGLSLPFFVVQRQRRAEEAALAERNLDQIRHAMRKGAEQDATQRREAVPVDGNSTEAVESQ
jgi:hypothetical protein